jgi:NAD(P)-dependent dehydrogenase (short-subunit alcohol dehydrogenase family)
MGRFTDKVVVVTGSGSGIGRATAVRIASEGGRVACLDLDEEAAQATAIQIGADGGEATAYRCNVADEDEVGAAVDRVVTDLDTPSVLCNIAGIHRFAHSHEEALDAWQKILDVNLTGTFLMCRAVLPHLLEHGGTIVNTASNAGLQGMAYSAAYCASKGGVVLLTKALALEYSKEPVRINAVAPGGVDTALSANMVFPDEIDMGFITRAMSPLGIAQPEDIASLFAYVASDEARYMTGTTVSMDGGLTI